MTYFGMSIFIFNETKVYSNDLLTKPAVNQRVGFV